MIADASEGYAFVGKSIEIVTLNQERVVAELHTFLARLDKYNIAAGFATFVMQSWLSPKEQKYTTCRQKD